MHICPRTESLTTITMRKSIQCLPFFLYKYGAPLGGPLGCSSSGIKWRFFLATFEVTFWPGTIQLWHLFTSWYSPRGVRYCKISLCCIPSVRGERENDMGITWYPPLGTHVALPEERAILFGFTRGEDLVGSKLLPVMQRTVSNHRYDDLAHSVKIN